MIGWVRVDAGIADDAKIALLAERLYPAGGRKRRANEPDEEAAVIGHLVKLWGKMAAHAKTGELATVPDRLLEQWAGWRGEPGLFAAVSRAILCGEDGRMSAWEKHNGAAIRRAEEEAERKRRAREEAARRRAGDEAARAGAQDGKPPGGTTSGGTSCVTDETDGRTDVLPREKEPLTLTAREASDSEDTPPDPLVGLLARFTPEDRPALLGFLARVSDRDRFGWARRMIGYLQGLEFPAGLCPTPGQLAIACRDWSRDEPPSPATFRAFVLRVIREHGGDRRAPDAPAFVGSDRRTAATRATIERARRMGPPA